MPLATLTLELAIEHAQSLKDRRQVVRSLKDKLRHGFNVSVAELDDALLWNRATLGIAALSGSSGYLAGQLREVEAAARRWGNGLGCTIIDSYIESDVVLDESAAACDESAAMPDESAVVPDESAVVPGSDGATARDVAREADREVDREVDREAETGQRSARSDGDGLL